MSLYPWHLQHPSNGKWKCILWLIDPSLQGKIGNSCSRNWFSREYEKMKIWVHQRNDAEQGRKAFVCLCKLSITTYFLPSSRRLTKAIIYASSDLEDFGKQGVPGQVLWFSLGRKFEGSIQGKRSEGYPWGWVLRYRSILWSSRILIQWSW